MRKEEMVTLLRSAGVDENAVTLAMNAWELGSECEREECARICESLWNTETNGMATEEEAYGSECAAHIRQRGMP